MKIRDKVLPVLKPLADQSDIDDIAETIKSGWWGRGPKVEKLEKDFSKLVGSKYAVAVTSNSVGIDLSLKVLGVNKEATDGEIRKRWIELSKELHPDQLSAQGVPQELIIKSEDRLSEINQAYDKIKSIRNIN